MFLQGTDEHTDPYRMFHGGWHLFTGLAGYFDWQLLVIDKTKNRRRNTESSTAYKEECFGIHF